MGELWEVEERIRRLQDTNPRIRAGNALSLGEDRVQKAVEPLMAGLRDDNLIVVGACARALGQIGDKRAIPELVNTLYRLLDQYDSVVLETTMYLACASEGMMRSDWREWCASAAQPVPVGSISSEEQKVYEILEKVKHDLDVSMQLLGGRVYMEIMRALAKLGAPEALLAIGRVLDFGAQCINKLKFWLLEDAAEALQELMKTLPDDASLLDQMRTTAGRLVKTAQMKVYFSPYEGSLEQGWLRTRIALLRAHSAVCRKMRRIKRAVRRAKGGIWNTFLSWFGV